ncbi:MAG: polyphosphate kinase 2, partial [Acetobacter orientalis]
MSNTTNAQSMEREHIRREIIDDLDEEFELSLEEEAVGGTLGAADRAFRRTYFKELIRLQGELVKLQDWVKATGHRVVVIFE